MTAKPPIYLRPPHAYDNPQISPKDFLLAVMRDAHVSLPTRIEAATYALPLTCAPPATARVNPDLVIKVPPLPVDDGEPVEPAPPLIQ
jgi:hypothetical protein